MTCKTKIFTFIWFLCFGSVTMAQGDGAPQSLSKQNEFFCRFACSAGACSVSSPVYNRCRQLCPSSYIKNCINAAGNAAVSIHSIVEGTGESMPLPPPGMCPPGSNKDLGDEEEGDNDDNGGYEDVQQKKYKNGAKKNNMRKAQNKQASSNEDVSLDVDYSDDDYYDAGYSSNGNNSSQSYQSKDYRRNAYNGNAKGSNKASQSRDNINYEDDYDGNNDQYDEDSDLGGDFEEDYI